MSDDLNTGMVAFVQAVTTTMGLSLNVNIGPIEDGTRITLDGEGCDIFIQRKGALLDALQHIVNAAFRHEHRGATSSSIAATTVRGRMPSSGRPRSFLQSRLEKREHRRKFDP